MKLNPPPSHFIKPHASPGKVRIRIVGIRIELQLVAGPLGVHLSPSAFSQERKGVQKQYREAKGKRPQCQILFWADSFAADRRRYQKSTLCKLSC